MELHEPPWSSMSLHGVPDNVGGPPAGPRFSLNNDMYEASVDIGVAIDACMYGL